MGTRSIVTSQPDVACDVCARRLLRGEQPDVFLAAGRRLTVCELCAPRATHEGWKRETEQPDLALPPMRPRRARGLLDRLRGLAPQAGEGGASPARLQPESRPGREASAGVPPDSDQPVPFDVLEDGPRGAQDEALPGEADPLADEAGVASAPALSPYLQQALDIFNDSEYPRRIAGVSRSLGPPIVHVRSAEHLDSIVEIVVAWELCWYRYGVDLSIEQPLAEAGQQGTELEELDREQRQGNATAHDSGTLALAQ